MGRIIETPEVRLGHETYVIDVNYRRKLRMDNAGENKKLEEILKLNNFKIYFEYTHVDDPEFNSVVERKFSTGYGRVRAMLNG